MAKFDYRKFLTENQLTEHSRVLVEGTRSAIGIRGSGGKIEWIYVHWDGYLAGVGKTLKQSYRNPSKIKKLIAGGDVSSLEGSLKGTTFYARDKGESMGSVRPKLSHNPKAFGIGAANMGAEYIYLYEPKKGWVYMEFHEKDAKWKSLK